MRALVEIDWEHDGCEVRTAAVVRGDPFRRFGDLLAIGWCILGPWFAVAIGASAHPSDVMGWRLRFESLAILLALLAPVAAWWRTRERFGVVPAAKLQLAGREIRWEVAGRTVGPLPLARVEWIARATEGNVASLVIRAPPELLRLAVPASEADRLDEVEGLLHRAAIEAWATDEAAEPVPEDLRRLTSR